MKKPDGKYMRLAIQEAKKNFKRLSGGPFGACIVKNDRVVSIARNTVLKEDATCHAEINAIRLASKKLKTFNLVGCVIYSTTEPCPMCFSAIHWAGINTIVYGTSISDAKKIGFRELSISCKKLNRLGNAAIKLVPGFLYQECLELFGEWEKLENKQLY
ncbi:MAG: nucleoside deaminase [Candidatus Omnitrophica bacterium]|nr:nucleoside deaminase [Candidatus Omnitrophota bacterium]